MRTEIATLGEFGLIDRLTEGIKPENESTRYGVGDDAAVLSYPSEKQILVTTDLLMEGVHFDLTYVPLKHLGCSQFLRYLCNEWYSTADYRFTRSFQTLQRRRYGRALLRYSSGMPAVSCRHYRRRYFFFSYRTRYQHYLHWRC